MYTACRFNRELIIYFVLLLKNRAMLSIV